MPARLNRNGEPTEDAGDVFSANFVPVANPPVTVISSPVVETPPVAPVASAPATPTVPQYQTPAVFTPPTVAPVVTSPPVVVSPTDPLAAARNAYLSTPDALPNYSDSGFVSWWKQNFSSTNPADYPADFNLLTQLAGAGNADARQVLAGSALVNTGTLPAPATGGGTLLATLFSPAPTPGQTAPSGTVADQFLNPPDTSGDVVAQLGGMLSGLLSAVTRPNQITTIDASTTTTNNFTDQSQYDFSTHTTDNSVTNVGYSSGDVSNLLNTIFDRFPGLASVPSGGNVVTPSSPPAGYAPNIAQSAQRTGFQTVASVVGLDNSPGGIGGPGIPWKAILAGAVVIGLVYFVLNKFFR